jgi:hypothetical protein
VKTDRAPQLKVGRWVRVSLDMIKNMKSKSKFAVAAFLLFALSQSVSLYAQSPAPSVTPTPTPIVAENNQPKPSDEVIVLRAQLETMRQYDQRLLETVYWSLASLGAVVLLIVGLGWYTNFRLYKREVNDIKREIQNALRVEMVAAARDAANSALRDFKKMQYQLLKIEAEKFERDGYKGSAVFTYARMIEVAQSFHPELYIPEILDEMLRILKDEETNFHSGIASEISKAVDGLPKEYGADKDAILQLVRAIRAK